MSLLKISGNLDDSTPLQKLVNSVNTTIKQGGSEHLSPTFTQQVCNLESLSQHELANLNTSAASISSTLRTIYEGIFADHKSLGFEDLTPAQLEAGVMVAMAAGNPVLYAKSALNTDIKTPNGVPVIAAESYGAHGNLDYRFDVALEAFDERELARMLPYSVVFNIQAARQNEFSETFYPTTVVSPDKAGYEIDCSWITVFKGHKRPLAGTPSKFDQRKLIEAVVDHKILEDEATKVVPFRNPESDPMFVDIALVPPFNREVSGVEIPTGPLRIGAKADILGLSQHPGLIGLGVMDETDALDGRLYLEYIYVATGNANEVVRFNVSRLPRNGFLKSHEGNDRELTLNFKNDSILINAGTQTIDGVDPVPFDVIRVGDLKVQVSINLSGHANVEFGTVQIYNAPITVQSIRDTDHNPVALDSPDGLAVITALENMSVIGYELNARRTNSNRRTRGLLINSNSDKEVFPIPLGSPISAQSPIGSDRDAKDLENLIIAARIRNDNSAMTTLLNYSETLRDYVTNQRLDYAVPVIEGIGRHMIVPFYEEHTLDMMAIINSLKSKERAEDITAVFINAIRDVVYRMYRLSGYQAALDASSIGGKRPTLLVGTDTIIQRHLMLQGENRTFGLAFEDAKIVTSMDARIDNKIILTFTRSGGESGRPDPLSFGTHAWMPELVSSITVTRDGRFNQEAMVQPRNRWINNLPIMAVFNVVGLKEVLVSKVGVLTHTATP